MTLVRFTSNYMKWRCDQNGALDVHLHHPVFNVIWRLAILYIYILSSRGNRTEVMTAPQFLPLLETKCTVLVSH